VKTTTCRLGSFIFDPNVGGSGIHGSARLEGSRGEQSFGGLTSRKMCFNIWCFFLNYFITCQNFSIYSMIIVIV
jgi:hypothetical protein